MAINTRTIEGRRTLAFTSIDQIVADVDQLAEAERQGKLKLLGNWTFGQTLGHMAAWVGYAYDGIPIKVPLLVRWFMKPMKRRMLYKALRSGLRIPGTKDGTVGTEVLSSEEGLKRFRAACERLKTEPPTRPHMFFGQMTHNEWISLQLRHAECHLSHMRIE